MNYYEIAFWILLAIIFSIIVGTLCSNEGYRIGYWRGYRDGKHKVDPEVR